MLDLFQSGRLVRFLLIFSCAALMSGVCAASAITHRVPAEYPTIQAALDASSLGDTVLVAPGTYTESSVRNFGGFLARSCAFMADGVILQSEGGPGVTTIDLLGVSGVPTAVVRCWGLPSSNTKITGFTITGAPLQYRGAYVFNSGEVTFENCVFRDMDAGSSTGAGIGAVGNLTVIGCTFHDCFADDGAAIAHTGGHLNLLDSMIRDCGSSAVQLEGLAGGADESALISGCVFIDNWSDGNSGALAISQYNAGAVVRDCRFERNHAAGSGGGAMTFANFGEKLIEGCLFLQNSVGPSAGQGGALTVGGNGFCTIRGNTFFGNSQTFLLGGSAVYVAGFTRFEANVVAASLGPAAIYVAESEGGQLNGFCNVYWENEGSIGVPLGDTDREVDPQFCDVAVRDFSVRKSSPCVEPGADGCGQIGAFGVGCEPLSVETQTWSRTKALYR